MKKETYGRCYLCLEMFPEGDLKRPRNKEVPPSFPPAVLDSRCCKDCLQALGCIREKEIEMQEKLWQHTLACKRFLMR